MEISPTVYLICLAILVIITTSVSLRAFRSWQRPKSLILNSLSDAIIVVDQSDEITDVNPAARDLLGLNSFDKKIPVFSILPQPEQFKEIWDAPGISLKLEFARDGIPEWYEARVNPIFQKNQAQVGRMVVIHNITREQILLRAEKRRSQQLELLEETGRVIADSFSEKEILQRAVDAIIEKFGYASAAISILTDTGMLQLVAIAGAGYPGYEIGYVQPLGSGIIGHTAEIQKTYVSNNVGKDPYYYSTLAYFGSAICTPLWKQGSLFGVLYVESKETDAFDEIDIKTLEALAAQISGSIYRASLYFQTRENLHTLSTIQEISRAIASSLDLETISKTVVNRLQTSFGYTHVSIYILEDDYLNLFAQVDYPEELIISKIHISQGVIGRTARTKSIQFIKDTSKEESFLKADYQIASEICIPLLKEDTVLGILNVESSEPDKLTQADVELLTVIAGPVALAVDNARLHAQIKKMATTDAVTGLSNRHIFEQTLKAEVERAQRKNIQVSLIIFDIDSFKEYNDTWGHPAGDARLKAVADIIQANLRKYDIASRYGGDEFAIILSDCTQENALLFAERLHHATQAGAPYPSQDGMGAPGYTLSMGIATFPLDASGAHDLLIAADHAALRAKQQGKNRIKLASDYGTH